MPDDALQNPFVIQCRACSTVLADSFALKNYRNNALVVSAVSSSAIEDQKKVLSKDAADADCWFYPIRCRCSAVVGKKYITVNAACNGHAGMYCIDQQHVYTYALGTTAVRTDLTLSEVAEEIDKLQRFCVYLYRRIENKK